MSRQPTAVLVAGEGAVGGALPSKDSQGSPGAWALALMLSIYLLAVTRL